jgi:hypothetical protein
VTFVPLRGSNNSVNWCLPHEIFKTVISQGKFVVNSL